jgi:tetratricopeptide (TPR) repeat protein
MRVLLRGDIRRSQRGAWWSSVLALLVSSAVPTMAAEGTLPENLKALFARGVEAQKANRPKEAETAFLEVLRQGGQLAFVYNNLGIVYQQQGTHLRAIRQFREALRLEPEYAAPRFLLGASLLALGKTAEAIAELQKAVQLDPTQRLGRLQLIKAYEVAGNPAGVVDEYRHLVEEYPREPEYAYQLGKAYMKLSEWAFERMKRLNPRSARLYQTLAAQYRLQGRDELAIRALQEAIELDPALPELHLALAEIYSVQGKTAEAQQALEKELSIMPGGRAALALKEKLRRGTGR